MKKQKRILSLTLAVVMALALLPATASAANSEWEIKEVLAPKYDYMANFCEGLAAVKLNGKLGFIDTTGKEVIPCKYTYPDYTSPEFHEGFVAVELDGKWGAIDRTGKEVIPFKYEAVGEFDQGLARVLLGGKWGLVDTTGKEIAPCIYNAIEEFSEGLAVVAAERWWHGFIDTSGKEVIPCDYLDAKAFLGGIAAVKIPTKYYETGYVEGKWGFIDKTGTVVVPGKYDDAKSLSNGVGAVEITTDEGSGRGRRIINRWGLVDTSGKEITEIKYDSIWWNEEIGLAKVVGEDRKEGYVDATGKEVVPCIYNNDVSDVLIRLVKAGYVDPTGKEVLFNAGLWGFSEGLAAAGIRGEDGYGRWGFVDWTGATVIPFQYKGVRDFSEGLAIVQDFESELWGAIDRTGKVVIPFQFTYLGSFSEGLAAARVEPLGGGEKFGYIDKTGKVVTPYKYSTAWDLKDGVAHALSNVGWQSHYINKEGKEFLSVPSYVAVWVLTDGLVCVSESSSETQEIKTENGVEYVHVNRTRLMDTDGNYLNSRQYSVVGDYSEGVLAVAEGEGSNRKWGLASVRKKGEPAPVAPAAKTAAENVQTVKVDGKDVSFAMYSPDNGGTNYVRLVDLAVALKGTAGQFNVGYDGKVLLTTGVAYTGAASTAPFHSAMEYTMLDEPTYVNGVARNLEGIRFEYQGLGYTYYKLRDLGQALGFNVGWDRAGEFIYIESGKAYDPNN